MNVKTENIVSPKTPRARVRGVGRSTVLLTIFAAGMERSGPKHSVELFGEDWLEWDLNGGTSGTISNTQPEIPESSEKR